MASSQEVDFRPSDLISHSGVGSQGELLVNTLLDHYPAELQAAQLKRVNERLDSELDEKALRAVAKIAGVDRIEQARVRGGERRDEDAVVTYAYFDDRGTVWKGCFPYSDLASGKSDAHVSQRDSLAGSTTAQQYRDANPQSAQQENAGQQTDPLALFDASADDLVALMREHPDRVEQIKALEQTRGKNARKTVLEYEPPSDEGDGSGGGD